MLSEEVLPGFERPLSFGYDPPPLENLDSYSLDSVHHEVQLEGKGQDRHLAICGLSFGTDGRSCKNHEVCGSLVDIDQYLRMKYVEIKLETGTIQKRIGVYGISGEICGCLVGFLIPCYFECSEFHNAMTSGLVNVKVIRMWKNTDPRANLLHGGAADCRWILNENMNVKESALTSET